MLALIFFKASKESNIKSTPPDEVVRGLFMNRLCENLVPKYIKRKNQCKFYYIIRIEILMYSWGALSQKINIFMYHTFDSDSSKILNIYQIPLLRNCSFRLRSRRKCDGHRKRRRPLPTAVMIPTARMGTVLLTKYLAYGKQDKIELSATVSILRVVICCKIFVNNRNHKKM